jgi:hypothetical protein
MDAIRFDALARSLVVAGSRRSLLAAVSGIGAAFLARFSDEAQAGCKKVGKNCDKKKCCAGARCRHGRCRCKKEWTECGGDGLCRNLSSDPEHCGACGQSCLTGCCAGGVCRDMCGDDCCTECFALQDSQTGDPILETSACCASSKVCNRGTSDLADDRCCAEYEACIDGECCCDGCAGTVVCGGACCPSGSCCNGKCCGDNQVCARTNKNKPRQCVSADRSCTSDGDCFEDETCASGTCCLGDRLCFPFPPDTDPFCCPFGQFCEAHMCCENGDGCGSGKKVRIRV